jgi:hypothetical protein
MNNKLEPKYNLDLTYLEDFKDIPLIVQMQLDPRGHRGHVMEEFQGLIHGVVPRAIDLATIASGMPGIMTLAYLGKEDTVWTIKTLDGSKILNHKKIDDGKYLVLGPNEKVMGKVYLDLPYKTPYGDLYRQIERWNDKLPSLHIDPNDLIPDKAFNLWRNRQFDMQREIY